LLSSPPPSLIQESLLCNHPHAIAKTPSKQAYSTPLNNIAISMIFLLPGNKRAPGLFQEPLRCNHPHAIAKTPSKQAYSTPLNNIAISMMFLLPGNVCSLYSSPVMS
jgi:hypothetical protein